MLALDRSGSATNYLPSTILHFTFVQTLIENPLSCKEDEHGVGWVRGYGWVGTGKGGELSQIASFM